LGPVDEHGHGLLQYGGAPVPKKMNSLGGAGRRVRGFFSPVEEPAAIESAQADSDQRELTGSGRPSEGGRPSDERP